MRQTKCRYLLYTQKKTFNDRREKSLQPEFRLVLQTAQEIQLVKRRDQTKKIQVHRIYT